MPAFGQSPASAPSNPATAENAAEPQAVPIAQVTFFSHSFGENFPHAFVIVEQADPWGQPVFDAFGFSAKHLSPKILFGRVDGDIVVPSPRYVRQSDPHFTLAINAEQKYRLNQVKERWSGARYHLKKQNCVHFIAELVEAMGLRIDRNSEHFKEPKSFLEEVVALNPVLQENLRGASNWSGQ